MTIKRNLLMLAIIFFTGVLCAQVGINTKVPQGIFHVDPKGDTAGTSGAVDDLIIDSKGYLGIGTLTPKTRVDVEGSLSIMNAGEAENYILTSDNNGVGTWQSNTVTRVNRMSIYEVSGVFPLVPLAVSTSASTTLEALDNAILTVNELNLTINSSNKLVLPPGLYMLIFDFDLTALNEYGQSYVFKRNTVGSPFSKSIISAVYRGYLEGAVSSVLLTDEVELSIFFALKTFNASSGITYFDIAYPFYNAPYKGRLQIIQLQ